MFPAPELKVVLQITLLPHLTRVFGIMQNHAPKSPTRFHQVRAFHYELQIQLSLRWSQVLYSGSHGSEIVSYPSSPTGTMLKFRSRLHDQMQRRHEGGLNDRVAHQDFSNSA